MWWRKAPLAIVMLALSLGGCGFHPLYGSRSTQPASKEVKTLLSRVYVAAIDDRIGQILHTNLMERLRSEDNAAPPLYRLQITLQEKTNGINFQKNASASGGELTMVANWILLPYSGQKPLISGNFTTVDNVDYLGPRYASTVAERDAESLALTNIADVITDRVALYLAGHPPR
jgi:LPS-assembly lipoprotein